jgi:hypothetical protein
MNNLNCNKQKTFSYYELTIIFGMRKVFLRLNLTECSISASTPHFANTLLAVVFISLFEVLLEFLFVFFFY